MVGELSITIDYPSPHPNPSQSTTWIRVPIRCVRGPGPYSCGGLHFSSLALGIDESSDAFVAVDPLWPPIPATGGGSHLLQ